MGFPNQPISMCFAPSNTLIPFYPPVEGFRPGLWIGNHQFGGYPKVGANFLSRPDIEREYGLELLKRGSDEWAAVIDLEQWSFRNVPYTLGDPDIVTILKGIIATLRHYAVGPMLTYFFYPGENYQGYPAGVPAGTAFLNAWLHPSTAEDFARRDASAAWFAQQLPIYRLAGSVIAALPADHEANNANHYEHLLAVRYMLDELGVDLPLHVWTNGQYTLDSGEPEISAQTANEFVAVIERVRGTPAVWGPIELSTNLIRAIQRTIL